MAQVLDGRILTSKSGRNLFASPKYLASRRKLTRFVMCDYSLEMYQSRPARQGEEYVSNKFPSGSIGFVARGDQSVAICMACDTRLRLECISPLVQEQVHV